MTVAGNPDGRTGVPLLPIPKPYEFTLASRFSKGVRNLPHAPTAARTRHVRSLSSRQHAPAIRNGSRPRRPRSDGIIVETHNARHLLRSDGEGIFTQQLLHDMQQSRTFAYLLQEVEQKEDQSGTQLICGHTLIFSQSVSNLRNPRPPARSGRAPKSKAPRSEPGLAGILLSPTASRSWDGVTRCFGTRIVAARCELPQRSRGKSHVFLVSAYAPHTGRHSSEHDQFLEDLGDCMAATKSTDLLQIGIDGNGDMGVRADGNTAALGPLGVPRVNARGRTLCDTIESLGLCSTATFFGRRRKNAHVTWFHPATKRGHQLDHVLVRRSELRWVTSARKVNNRRGSDHHPVRCRTVLPPRWHKARRNDDKPKPRPSKGRVDRSRLQDPDVSATFRDTFSKKFAQMTVTLAATMLVLQTALVSTAEDTLTTPPAHAKRAWFCAEVEAAIQLRDLEQVRHDQRHRGARRRLALAKVKLRLEVRNAKARWAFELCDQMDRNRGQIWPCVKKLNAGSDVKFKSALPMMDRPDGSRTTTPAESAEALKHHLGQLYDSETAVDMDAVLELPPGPERPDLDRLPDMAELAHHVAKAQNGKATGEDTIAVEYLKAIMATDPDGKFESPEAAGMLLSAVQHHWTNKDVPPDWRIAILGMLHKKKSRSDPANYRTLSLLSVVAKLVASIIASRLQSVHDVIGSKSQCGFRPGFSGADAMSMVRAVLDGRRQYDLPTWIVACDLKRAFDRVDRPQTWAILRRYGISDDMVSRIEELYKDNVVKLRVDHADDVFAKSTVGVKQGDCLSPVLFLFVMAAAMETMSWPDTIAPIKFAWNSDGRVQDHTSRWPRDDDKTAADDTGTTNVEYADDLMLMFQSRPDLSDGFTALNTHMLRFGLEFHLARSCDSSKTVAMYVPSPSHPASKADLSPIMLPATTVGGQSQAAGRVDFAKELKYLGSIISSDLSDTTDITARIKSASQVFGALRQKVLGNSRVTALVKCRVYESAVLATLLHNSEFWALTMGQVRRLQVFHHRCCRAMAGVNMWKTRKLKITSAALLQQLGLKPIHTYAQTRFLRTVGRIARMPTTRLSRQLLGAWLPDAVRHASNPPQRLGTRLRLALEVRIPLLSPKDKAVFGHQCRHGWGTWLDVASNLSKPTRHAWHELTQTHPVLSRDHNDTTQAYLKQRP